MRIGELAAQAGVRRSTIRYYERRGLLPAPRPLSGHRRYDAHALRRLRFVRLAQAAGMTLEEVRRLVDGFPVGTPAPQRWASVRTAKLAAIERRIAALQLAKRILRGSARCRCRRLEECGDKSVALLGD